MISESATSHLLNAFFGFAFSGSSRLDERSEQIGSQDGLERISFLASRMDILTASEICDEISEALFDILAICVSGKATRVGLNPRIVEIECSPSKVKLYLRWRPFFVFQQLQSTTRGGIDVNLYFRTPAIHLWDQSYGQHFTVSC